MSIRNRSHGKTWHAVTEWLEATETLGRISVAATDPSGFIVLEVRRPLGSTSVEVATAGAYSPKFLHGRCNSGKLCDRLEWDTIMIGVYAGKDHPSALVSHVEQELEIPITEIEKLHLIDCDHFARCIEQAIKEALSLESRYGYSVMGMHQRVTRVFLGLAQPYAMTSDLVKANATH